MQERNTSLLEAMIDRLMDELPVLFLGAIAVMIVLSNNADLIEKVVLSIVTGFLGYMKGKVDRARATPPAPVAPPAPIVAWPTHIVAPPGATVPPAADPPQESQP